MAHPRDIWTPPKEGWIYPSLDSSKMLSGTYHGLFKTVKDHYEVNGKEPPTREQVEHWMCENLSIPCVEDGRQFDNAWSRQESVTPFHLRPIPYPDWPTWAKAMKLLSKPEDSGLGDTVRRIIGDDVSDAFKTWYKRVSGVACGCEGRQARLNANYSYLDQNIQPH